jgi:hypothetical protein
VCRKLDTFCDDSYRGATCIGLCIPAPKPPPAKGTPKATPAPKATAKPKEPTIPAPVVQTTAPKAPQAYPAKSPSVPAHQKGSEAPKGKGNGPWLKTAGLPETLDPEVNLTQTKEPLQPDSVVQRSFRASA